MVVYRSNVAAILENLRGEIFVGERYEVPGSWQFPQGGVDSGEKLRAALRRELKEEIGVKRKHVEILEFRDGYRYKFPKGKVKWGKFRGQKQRYYRCLFTGSDKHINIQTEHPEFMAWKWIRPEEFQLGWLPGFKKDVYVAVFRDFFGLDLSGGKR